MQEVAAELFIAIGSNLGYRFENIQKALHLIAKHAIANMQVSIIFETKAILPPEAPEGWNLPYLNLVVTGTPLFSPIILLKALKEIEKKLGRDLQAPRWAPRVIDLDILAWEDKIVSEETLTIPHPELMNRPFLLSLMASLRPHWRYPVQGFSYSQLTLSEILHSHVKFDLGHSKCFSPFPRLVGIVNVTPDSFSDGGCYFHAEQAMQKIQDLTAEGAAVIDIGAQSTRPKANAISAEEEWARLKPVLEMLKKDMQNQPTKAQISIDSYYPEVILKALQIYPIDFINDVKGGEEELDSRILEILADTACKLIITHSLTVPAEDKSILPFESSPLVYLNKWAEETISRCSRLGINQERIILDPGIGFGKSPFQSLSLLLGIEELKKTGCEILVGHSRKSFLKIMTNASDRDMETIGISHYLVKKRVDYLRVHDVAAHQRSLAAFALIGGLHDL